MSRVGKVALAVALSVIMLLSSTITVFAGDILVGGTQKSEFVEGTEVDIADSVDPKAKVKVEGVSGNMYSFGDIDYSAEKTTKGLDIEEDDAVTVNGYINVNASGTKNNATGIYIPENLDNAMVSAQNINVKSADYDAAGVIARSGTVFITNSISSEAEGMAYGVAAYSAGAPQDKTWVLVGGNVDAESKNGYCIGVENVNSLVAVKDSIIAMGSQDRTKESYAVYTHGDATLLVGGDIKVIGDRECTLAIDAYNDSTIIVEGTIDGEVKRNNDAKIYAGAVADTVTASNISGFLLGSGEDITGNYNVNGSITSLDKDSTISQRSFYVVNSQGEPFTIYATNGSKITGVTGIDAAYVKINADGSVTITPPALGGMQDLSFSLYVSQPSTSGSTAIVSNPYSNYGISVGSAVTGEWKQNAETGAWSILVNGQIQKNTWVPAMNPYASADQPKASWFYFDENGNMLTGWQWITGKDGVTRCYYLNPTHNGIYGACYLNGVTPDGYMVDETGAWTVNGKVQTR